MLEKIILLMKSNMKKNDFNWLDSIIETTKARKKKKGYDYPELPMGVTISLASYYWLLYFNSVTIDSPSLLYVVVGIKYKKSGRRVYTLQPSVFNDSQYHPREVEDSVKLIVWNEQKQKWQTRTEYAEDSTGDEKST